MNTVTWLNMNIRGAELVIAEKIFLTREDKRDTRDRG